MGDKYSRQASLVKWLLIVLILVVVGNLIYTTFFLPRDRGYQTIVGNVGPQGTPGPEGPRGLTGFTGEQGPVGPQGSQGLQGERGPQGEQGVQGLQGAMGLQGEQGPVGQSGADGLPGPQGLPGNPGSPGKDGRELELRGNNDKKQIEWRYVGEDDSAWRVLARYCDLLGTCVDQVNR